MLTCALRLCATECARPVRIIKEIVINVTCRSLSFQKNSGRENEKSLKVVLILYRFRDENSNLKFPNSHGIVRSIDTLKVKKNA